MLAERDGGGSESQECVQGKRYEREMKAEGDRDTTSRHEY